MKTCLLLLSAFTAGTAFGQVSGPVSPQSGTFVTARAVQLHHQGRQPAPPPVGFWVIEESVKSPAIAHFYSDNRQEIRTDTLRRKHLNLKRHIVINQLNQRLDVLINDLQTNTLVLRKP